MFAMIKLRLEVECWVLQPWLGCELGMWVQDIYRD